MRASTLTAKHSWRWLAVQQYPVISVQKIYVYYNTSSMSKVTQCFEILSQYIVIPNHLIKIVVVRSISKSQESETLECRPLYTAEQKFPNCFVSLILIGQ